MPSKPALAAPDVTGPVRQHVLWLGELTAGFGPHVVGRGAAVLLVPLLTLTGCSILGGSSTELESTAPAPYGVTHILPDTTTPLLVGVAPWCVTDGPVELETLKWTSNTGVRITGYSVVNQAAAIDTLGTELGPLTRVELNPDQNRLTTRCAEEEASGSGQAQQVSYLVLEVRPEDANVSASAQGLEATWRDENGHRGSFTEQFGLALCPPETASCEQPDG